MHNINICITVISKQKSTVSLTVGMACLESGDLKDFKLISQRSFQHSHRWVLKR